MLLNYSKSIHRAIRPRCLLHRRERSHLCTSTVRPTRRSQAYHPPCNPQDGKRILPLSSPHDRRAVYTLHFAPILFLPSEQRQKYPHYYDRRRSKSSSRPPILGLRRTTAPYPNPRHHYPNLHKPVSFHSPPASLLHPRLPLCFFYSFFVYCTGNVSNNSSNAFVMVCIGLISWTPSISTLFPRQTVPTTASVISEDSSTLTRPRYEDAAEGDIPTVF